ncbi:MAG TPA: hypothetical protein VFW40_07690, partial [Capsulimonadaceae bacterium]|nr:hypothetical protein [Capsulimonadaceae bacterium]
IVDPARFYQSLQSGMTQLLKRQPSATRNQLREAPIGKQAETFALGLIGRAAANVVGQMRMPPGQFANASESVKQSLGTGVAAAFAQVGLECTGFEVSNSPQVRRAPCSKCGSVTAPTAYGEYRRTISLLYVRFGARQSGNYCVPCAAKVWGAYCGVMLICGWWGLIGLVLTPVYICQNTYYFLRTAFGKKAASGDAAHATAASTAWPPAPAEDWGQEVQEQ